jgi:hypothetical protein
MPGNGNMVCLYEKAGIKMDYITVQGIKAAVLTAEEKWNTVQDALDCMVTAAYKGCTGVIVPKECLPEAFFQLKTGFAGEVLQKFTNYHMKIAVTGDFSSYASQSLKDFIYESNKGRQVFFKATAAECLASFVKAAAI